MTDSGTVVDQDESEGNKGGVRLGVLAKKRIEGK